MVCKNCGHQSNGAPDKCPKCKAPRVAPPTCPVHNVALDKNGKCPICEKEKK